MKCHFLNFRIILMMVSAFAAMSLNAQKGNRLIGFEGGINFYEHSMPDFEFIRAHSSSIGSEKISIAGNFYGYYSGVNGEYFLSERISFQTGIRYSISHASIHKVADYSSKTDYFYVLAKTEENDSYYYKVKSIENSIHYLTVPLEFRYFIMPEYLFRLYVRVGVEAGFKVFSQPKVSFKSSGLLIKDETIMQNFDDPDPVYLVGNLSIGWKIGRPDAINFNIEGVLPSVFIPEMNSGLVEPFLGGGLRMCLQIPVKI